MDYTNPYLINEANQLITLFPETTILCSLWLFQGEKVTLITWPTLFNPAIAQLSDLNFTSLKFVSRDRYSTLDVWKVPIFV